MPRKASNAEPSGPRPARDVRQEKNLKTGTEVWQPQAWRTYLQRTQRMTTKHRRYGPFASDCPQWIIERTSVRRNEIEAVAAKARAGAGTRVLGPWGSGKSWLLGAVRAVLETTQKERVATVMINGEFWTWDDPEEVWRQIAQEIGIVTAQDRCRTACMEHVERTGERIVVFVDNADSARDEKGSVETLEWLVDKALNGTRHCACVAYSEGGTPQHQGLRNALTLEPLNAHDALELAAGWAQHKLSKEEEAVVTQRLGGRARAIAMFSQRQATTPIEESMADIFYAMDESRRLRLNAYSENETRIVNAVWRQPQGVDKQQLMDRRARRTSEIDVEEALRRLQRIGLVEVDREQVRPAWALEVEWASRSAGAKRQAS